jgi:hypothetical protein
MTDPITHTVLLIATVAVWLYASFPLLRYMLLLSEGKFNIRLIVWFLVMIVTIFFMKHSLVSLSGWPVQGSWSARLFFGGLLFLSIPIPFIWEYIKQIFRKKS